MTQESTLMSHSLTVRVSLEIRAELARQQMSQRRLADELGMQPSVFSKRLTGAGSRSFTTSEIDRIAEALHVPVDRLLVAPAAVAA